MVTAEKVDLFKELKAEYATPKTPALIRTSPGRYLTVVGKGGPAAPAFQEGIAAIYGVAYTIKFTNKKAGGQDFKIALLGGLWWVETGHGDVMTAPLSEFSWKLLVRVPGFVTEGDLTAAQDELKRKGKSTGAGNVKLETLDEGQCVQTLHVGPYDKEQPTIEAMMRFAAEEGLEAHGPHHEIYLSDPRRTKPERIKTILRHPVRPKKG